MLWICYYSNSSKHWTSISKIKWAVPKERKSKHWRALSGFWPSSAGYSTNLFLALLTHPEQQTYMCMGNTQLDLYTLTLQRISMGVDSFLSLIFSYFCFFVAAWRMIDQKEHKLIKSKNQKDKQRLFPSL